MAPKKPCSAKRSVAWVTLTNKITKIGVLCYIPGETNNLRLYSKVLIHGGQVSDLPGIHYKIIRSSNNAVTDLQSLIKRKKARSKYGTKKLTTRSKIRFFRFFNNNSQSLMKFQFPTKKINYKKI